MHPTYMVLSENENSAQKKTNIKTLSISKETFLANNFIAKCTIFDHINIEG